MIINRHGRVTTVTRFLWITALADIMQVIVDGMASEAEDPVIGESVEVTIGDYKALSLLINSEGAALELIGIEPVEGTYIVGIAVAPEDELVDLQPIAYDIVASIMLDE